MQNQEKIEEKQKSEIDLIYNDFEQGKIEYKDALDGVSVYKKSNVVSAYCKEVQGNIESLNSSRRAFEEGQKLEQEDDIPGAIKKAAGMPFAVLNNNKPSFYVVSPELFEDLSEILFDREVAAKVRERQAKGDFVSVNIEDL